MRTASTPKPWIDAGLRGLRAGLLLLVAVVVVAVACRPRSASPAFTLHAATWNIRWFPSGRPEPQEPRIEAEIIAATAAYVRRAEPHVLCLQEIRDRAAAEALAEATGLRGLRVAVCSAFLRRDGTPARQQLAILTNQPILEAGSERWTVEGFVDPPRGYAYALLDTPAGPVAVFNLHLKSNFIRDGLDREQHTELNRLKRELAGEQLRAVISRMEAATTDQPLRVVVAGDFNTSTEGTRWAGETTLTGFHEEGYRCAFEGLPVERTHTLHATPFYPAVTFDYILHKGFADQHQTHIHPVRWVSDHRMVSVRLRP